MAKTDAENQRAYRERLKQRLGEEEYKRLRREAYLKRKKKLQGELPKATLLDYLRSWIEVRELRRVLENAEKKSAFRRDPKLSDEEKLQIEVAAQELYNFLCQNKGNFMDFVLSRRKSLNDLPALETAFFKEISDRLEDDFVKRVWEYIYSMLFSATSFSTTWEGFQFQVGVGEDFARVALHHLKEMDVIKFEEFRETVKGIPVPSEFSAWSRNRPPAELQEAVNVASRDHDVAYLLIGRGAKWVDYTVDAGKPEYYPAVNRQTVEEWENSGDPALQKRAAEIREGVRRAKAEGLKFDW